ncbi:hypothetical protein [Amycolatopsis sp. cmx-4-68]
MTTPTPSTQEDQLKKIAETLESMRSIMIMTQVVIPGIVLLILFLVLANR